MLSEYTYLRELAFFMEFTTRMSGRVFGIISASLYTTAVLVVFPIYINEIRERHIPLPTFFRPQCSRPPEDVTTARSQECDYKISEI